MIRRPEGPLKVALIDGNTTSARLMTGLMGELVECDVKSYCGAAEALKGIPLSKPNLVISEWHFPRGQSGAEFLQNLRHLDVMKGVPLIIIAAEDASDVGISAAGLGVAEVMYRPVNRIRLQELLGFLAGGGHSDLITTVGNPVEYEVELQLKQIDKLAPLPAVVAGILDITGDPNSSSRKLADAIQTDQALTAKILQIVNSAYYGFHREIGNIDHAVVILGYDEVVNVALAACIIQTFQNGQSPHFNMNQFWLHSLAAAYIARSLRAFKPEIISKDAFVAGLLHDLGKVVLYQHFRESFLQTIATAAEEKRSLTRVAQELSSPDHAEVGGIVADAWNLPEPLVKAIRMHHAPQLAGKQDYMVHMAHLANFFAHYRKIGHSGNPVPDPPHPESMRLFGLDPNDLDGAWKSLKVDVDAIERLHSSYIAG